MKFCIPFFLLIIVIRPVALPQNSHKIDSLNHVFKNAGHDTVAVNALIQLGEQWINTNPDTSIQIFRNTLVRFSLNRKNEPTFVQMRAKIFLKTGIAFKNKGFYDTAMVYYEKSLQLNQAINNKSGLISCNLNIGNVYKLKGINDKALEFLNKALLMSEQTDDKKLRLSSNIHSIFFKCHI